MRVQLVTPGALHTNVERILGWSFWEDAGAAAHVELRALSATGAIVGHIALAADRGETIILPKPTYIDCPGGCWVKEEAGSVGGVLYY